jgi:hypothetical protein
MTQAQNLTFQNVLQTSRCVTIATNARDRAPWLTVAGDFEELRIASNTRLRRGRSFHLANPALAVELV